KDKRGVDLISDVASSMRSQRSPPVRTAQGKRIEEGHCGKQVNQSDNDYNLSKTEHPACEYSKSGTHCYLRQGTQSQSYKQIGPNPFFQPVDSRYDAAGNVIETHEYKGISKSGERAFLRIRFPRFRHPYFWTYAASSI